MAPNSKALAKPATDIGLCAGMPLSANSAVAAKLKEATEEKKASLAKGNLVPRVV